MGANVQLPLLIDQFDLSYIVSQYLITLYLTAVRQDVNSLENKAAVQELEFAINLALSVLSEAKVTNIGSLSWRSLTHTENYRAKWSMWLLTSDCSSVEALTPLQAKSYTHKCHSLLIKELF